MFASEEIPRVFVFVNLPEGTKLEITDEVIRKVEGIVLVLPESELENVVANSGLQGGVLRNRESPTGRPQFFQGERQGP